VKADGTAYKYPEGHLFAGTHPDIPQERPAVLLDYLAALNTALGGQANVEAIGAEFFRSPVRLVRVRRTQREGGDILENPGAARYRQARSSSKFPFDFDPYDPTPFRAPPLDDDLRKITQPEVQRLLDRIKRNCGCAIGL
jgi:hypothetical protein